MSPLGPLRALYRRLAEALRSRGLRLAIALGVPYVAALVSIGSFLARGGTGQPTTLEVGLLALTLAFLFVYALGGAASG